MKSVAIIGGGITGLTTAFRLLQNNLPVTLYEAGPHVGGPMQTLEETGYLSEYGPNTILETSPKITSLIDDLGLTPRLLVADPRMNKNYVVRQGRLMQLPFSPFLFATSPFFSLSAKLRIALEPFIRSQPKSEDESLADFVLRRLGHEFLDHAIDPFVTGVYAGLPEDLSVSHGFPKLKALEDKYGSIMMGALLGARERRKRPEKERTKSRKLSFDRGLQILPDTLRAKLGGAVELHSEVTHLRQTAEGWLVTTILGHRAEQRSHSAVVLAGPAYKMAQIQIEANRETRLSLLGEMTHPPVARIAMGFRREDVGHPLDGFGFLVPKLENLKTLGTTFSSSIFSGRAPEGHVLLTTFIGGCRQPDLATLSPGKLFDLTLHDLQKILRITGKPTYQHHCLFPHAIPQYNVGHKKFVDLMHTTEAQLPGLYFAGSYRNGISAGNCIVSGHDVAERIHRYVAPSSRSPLLQAVA